MPTCSAEQQQLDFVAVNSVVLVLRSHCCLFLQEALVLPAPEAANQFQLPGSASAFEIRSTLRDLDCSCKTNLEKVSAGLHSLFRSFVRTLHILKTWDSENVLKSSEVFAKHCKSSENLLRPCGTSFRFVRFQTPSMALSVVRPKPRLASQRGTSGVFTHSQHHQEFCSLRRPPTGPDFCYSLDISCSWDVLAKRLRRIGGPCEQCCSAFSSLAQKTLFYTF